MSSTSGSLPRRDLLTIALEDYFQVGAFNRLIQRRQWYRFETRFEQNTLRVLDLLDRFEVKATFFVLGWVADMRPDLVYEVARRGHEIASGGYYHRSIQQMTPEEFRDDLARTSAAIERACGAKPLGYRLAEGWLGPTDLWALDVLAEQGFVYDSSIFPSFRTFRSEPWRRFVHRYRYGDRSLWEFPLSTVNFLGWAIPVAGGNYIRQFPQVFIRRALERWHRTTIAPFVMYFHVWEFDPEQPMISAASRLTRIRHYRNLEKMPQILEDYCRRYEFGSIADYLDLKQAIRAPQPGEEKSRIALAAERAETPVPASVGTRAVGGRATSSGRIPITLVLPCYNEELVLPYLANTLSSVETSLRDYDLHFVFVDDGSRDKTYDSLQRLFGLRPNCTVLRHKQNQGVAAAILTGIRNAPTEIVCSADCDCTYDPHEIKNMVPLMTADVDMVTASPYHPKGKVLNVPDWRLSLSKTASFLYRCVLRQKLSTYTSCFRVYRRSALANLELREGGYLGIAEMLGRLDLQGAKIVEYPATLEVRLLGRSKMKIVWTIFGHLRVLWRLAMMRLFAQKYQPKPRPREKVLPDQSQVLSRNPNPYRTEGKSHY